MNGSLAQEVERRFEEPGVGGSTPPGATKAGSNPAPVDAAGDGPLVVAFGEVAPPQASVFQVEAEQGGE